MHKRFRCKTDECGYEKDEKGFCPDHGELSDSEKSAEDLAVEKLLAGIGDVVEEKIDSALKEKGLDKLDSASKAIHGQAVAGSKAAKYEYVKSIMSVEDKSLMEDMDEKEQRTFLRKARIAYFFKSMIQFQITKDPDYLAHVKALAEGVDADGGYLTPTEFRAELVKDLLDKPFLRNMVRVIPMASDSLEMPTLATNVTTSWGTENASITTTTVAFGTLTLAPKRLNTMIYTSRELVKDSALAVIPLVTELMVEAIGREEDRVIVRGSGSGQPKGILTETLAGIDNGNDDTTIAVNIKKLPFKLSKGFRTNARWLINKQALEAISALRDSNNNFLLGGLETKGVDDMTLAGYPVHEQNDVGHDELVLGDLKYYFLGDRERISVETTTEGAGTFEKHQVAIKVVERIDGKVALTAAFRKLSNCGFD